MYMYIKDRFFLSKFYHYDAMQAYCPQWIHTKISTRVIGNIAYSRMVDVSLMFN